jgi:hypothetical protein
MKYEVVTLRYPSEHFGSHGVMETVVAQFLFDDDARSFCNLIGVDCFVREINQ